MSGLHNPPDHQLKALKADRKGQWSIRANSQWRVCFEWKDRESTGVEIADYH